MNRLRRRVLIASGALLASPLVRAQASKRIPTIGFLFPNPTPKRGGPSPVGERLKQLGWVRGENFTGVLASAEGREARLPAVAVELVAKKPDLIWAAGPEAAIAAARATKTIPIVFWGISRPVEHGLIETFARPGRNVTGYSHIAGFEHSKGLELLREIAPGRTRLAEITAHTPMVTVSGKTLTDSDIRLELRAPAERLGFELKTYVVSRREDIEPALAAIAAHDPQALYCRFTSLTERERIRIARFAIEQRLPSAYGVTTFVQAGGLLSYGASRMAVMLGSLDYVDRILRGARPAELPVVMPEKFEIAVNLKTAAAIGIEVPQSILLRADRVIE